ncbi:hypothetical protein [Natronococcus occultus]|uniref:Uncharacterized protein n=1 Tax=Natronococcus occultus SP4 TaxID=694430 RepID=L0K3Y8_9EURY|nr:hypothetical protein [Natronococcus occultus]AGB38798.1 hypothetical protein Natoc_3054 [Natronococcus occultus SP4]
MTKRDIEREFDEFTEEVLADLEPLERIQLVLEAEAAGLDRWVERLYESCPVRGYRGLDRTFIESLRIAANARQVALYDLHTTLLQRARLREHHRAVLVIDHERDDGLSEAALERARERPDRITLLTVDLYTQYHAYDRFAEHHLGVDLEIWFGPHFYADNVRAATSEVLEQAQPDDLEQFVNDGFGIERGDDDWVTLDSLVEDRYRAFRDTFTVLDESDCRPD